MKIRPLSWIILIIVATISFSCEVDDDDTPVASYIYNVSPSSWSGNINGFSTYLNVPEITNDIFYNGVVLVYMIMNEVTEDTHICQLPYSYIDNNLIDYMDYNTYVGGISIQQRQTINGRNSTVPPLYNYTFKVVLIDNFELPDTGDK